METKNDLRREKTFIRMQRNAWKRLAQFQTDLIGQYYDCMTPVEQRTLDGLKREIEELDAPLMAPPKRPLDPISAYLNNKNKEAA